MQNLLKALGDRRAQLAENGKQKGFTLVELLVVVIIIGILAGIAIPVFLNQREGAWRSELESDVKNLALAIETASVSNGGSYDAVPTGALSAANMETLDFQPSNDSSTFTVTVTDGDFTIVGTHPELSETLEYDTADGGLQDWAATTGTGTGTGTGTD